MVDAGYRHESDTSREAAEKLTTAQRNRALALDFIKSKGREGATIDEVCVFLSEMLGREVPPNAISGRFSELVDAGAICKTPLRRKTRSGKTAVVYYVGRWSDYVDAPQPPQSQIDKYRAAQAISGHGHVIPRNDGRREGCGGPSVCRQCRQAKAYFDLMS